MSEGPDPDLEAQMILLAASNHNLETLRTLLRTGSANVQDPETGYTPLHAAIAACAPEDETSVSNGEAYTNGQANGDLDGEATNGDDEAFEGDVEMETAKRTLKLLLQNGAIWNDLDKNNETPGCIARRLGLKELYEIMVDAGVRAEMLLNRLDGYEPLADDGEEEEKEEEEDPEVGDTGGEAQSHPDGVEPGVLHAEEEITARIEDDAKADVNSADYLRSDLTYSDDRLLDEEKNGVMMAWETEIMERTAELLLPIEGLRVLNIGHGMGIIDNFFQSKSPTSHHIVEAHTTVLAEMRGKGWYDKPGVTIHEGKWQDVLPKLIVE
ncbi:MAG: Arginine N-methyltransferase 2, partial [Pleopsidium flavum]